MHNLALHIQSRDRSIAVGEVLAVSNMAYPLPAELNALTMLTSLHLSRWTHAMLLPTAISFWKQLRLLSQQECAIMSLPDSLQQLTDLESLTLHMNDIGRYAHLVPIFMTLAQLIVVVTPTVCCVELQECTAALLVCLRLC